MLIAVQSIVHQCLVYVNKVWMCCCSCGPLSCFEWCWVEHVPPGSMHVSLLLTGSLCSAASNQALQPEAGQLPFAIGRPQYSAADWGRDAQQSSAQALHVPKGYSIPPVSVHILLRTSAFGSFWQKMEAHSFSAAAQQLPTTCQCFALYKQKQKVLSLCDTVSLHTNHELAQVWISDSPLSLLENVQFLPQSKHK